jgi:hypothetical protein
LGYAIGLVACNLLAVVKAAMNIVHGQEAVDTQVSTYYLASEATATWQGLEIAVAPRDWARRHANLTPAKLAEALVAMARHARIRHYQKHNRGCEKETAASPRPFPSRQHRPPPGKTPAAMTA